MSIPGSTTSSEQSTASQPTDSPPLPKLNDGRNTGAWTSEYPASARFWIYVELIYLLALMLGGMLVIAICAASRLPVETIPILPQRPFGTDNSVLFWLTTGMGGMLGGTVMTLKWHYHCVAKKLWHLDRQIWRITTPLLSAVVSLFVVMLFVSDILSVISVETINTPIGGPALAFLLGLFSDNILAALQNFAVRTIGTLRDTTSGGRQGDDG